MVRTMLAAALAALAAFAAHDAPAQLLGSPAGAPKKSDGVVAVRISATTADAAGKQTLTIMVTPQKPWYIYANPVGSETFESNATVVTVTQGGKKLDAQVAYPKGLTKKVELAGQVESYDVYEDEATIKADVTRTPGGGPLEVRVRVNSCRATTCLAPGTVVVLVP